MNEANEAPVASLDKEAADQGPESATRKVWQEKLKGLSFYHGTSEKSAKRKKEEGLIPRGEMYSSQRFIIFTLKKLGLDYGYVIGKESSIYLAADLKTACGYALDGSEMLRYFVLDNCDNLLAGQEGSGGVSLTSEEVERLEKIREEAKAALSSHRPALLKINRNSPQLREDLEGRFPGLLSLLEDEELFVNKVKTKAKELQITEEKAAEMLADRIVGGLSNFRFEGRISPEDLELISGEEFYQQTRETRKIKEIVDRCLFDEEKQPPELIRALEKGITYDLDNQEEILASCSYYGIGESRAKKILSRAERMKREERE